MEFRARKAFKMLLDIYIQSGILHSVSHGSEIIVTRGWEHKCSYKTRALEKNLSIETKKKNWDKGVKLKWKLITLMCTNIP